MLHVSETGKEAASSPGSVLFRLDVDEVEGEDEAIFERTGQGKDAISSLCDRKDTYESAGTAQTYSRDTTVQSAGGWLADTNVFVG